MATAATPSFIGITFFIGMAISLFANMMTVILGANIRVMKMEYVHIQLLANTIGIGLMLVYVFSVSDPTSPNQEMVMLKKI